MKIILKTYAVLCRGVNALERIAASLETMATDLRAIEYNTRGEQ